MVKLFGVLLSALLTAPLFSMDGQGADVVPAPGNIRLVIRFVGGNPPEVVQQDGEGNGHVVPQAAVLPQEILNPQGDEGVVEEVVAMDPVVPENGGERDDVVPMEVVPVAKLAEKPVERVIELSALNSWADLIRACKDPVHNTTPLRNGCTVIDGVLPFEINFGKEKPNVFGIVARFAAIRLDAAKTVATRAGKPLPTCVTRPKEDFSSDVAIATLRQLGIVRSKFSINHNVILREAAKDSFLYMMGVDIDQLNDSERQKYLQRFANEFCKPLGYTVKTDKPVARGLKSARYDLTFGDELSKEGEQARKAVVEAVQGAKKVGKEAERVGRNIRDFVQKL